jgi:hypothetical protein
MEFDLAVDRFAYHQPMNARYSQGKIEFDLHSLLESVSPETKLEMIESLSCDDHIIKHVADQIIDRWTESSYSGGSSCTIPADASRGCPLDEAWRRVARASGDVAKMEIERLERGLAQRDKQIADLHEELRKVYDRHRNQAY